MGLDLEAIHRFLCSIPPYFNFYPSLSRFYPPLFNFYPSLSLSYLPRFNFYQSLSLLYPTLSLSYPAYFYFSPSLSLSYPPHSIHHTPILPIPQLPQPKQKAHQPLGELSDNLLILVIGFEGAFHFAFGFFFAHVVAFVVVFFPFADAD